MCSARLDGLIAEMKAQTGSDQVDLLGHSLGTALMQAYLNSDPARARERRALREPRRRAGRRASRRCADPRGVGRRRPNSRGRRRDQRLLPGPDHVQVVTSSETFVEIYRFFNDADPIANEIVRQPAGQVTIAGRAVKFITNEPVVDAAIGHLRDRAGERKPRQRYARVHQAAHRRRIVGTVRRGSQSYLRVRPDPWRRRTPSVLPTLPADEPHGETAHVRPGRRIGRAWERARTTPTSPSSGTRSGGVTKGRRTTSSRSTAST